VQKSIFVTQENLEWNVEDFQASGIANYDIIVFSYYPRFSPNVSISDVGNKVGGW
jgi:hypothetical protein